MNGVGKNERIKIEEALIERYCDRFKLFARNGLFFVSGWVTTELNRYKLRLVLPPGYPYGRAPKMFIVSPKVLYTADGGSIRSLGCSHKFHTKNNLSGYVQISYTGHWDASCTCVGAIMKG